jgi:predicted phage terminase large subunit-like protein
MPGTVQTPAMDLIDSAIMKAFATPDSRTIITMPPQEGKSTRVTICGALWALQQWQDTPIAIASYDQNLANDFGRAIRNHITDNSGQEGTLDLGLRIAPDNGAVASWKLYRHTGGVRSVGIGAGLTGRPAGALFIDDPISNMEQAESSKYRERAWKWWLSVGSTRLAPGSPVIVILTRWHHDDLVGRLLAAEDGHLWDVINIPAQAEDDDDVLGREPGEFLESTRKRTVEQWQAIKTRSGPWIWNSLYQGNPTPRKGGIFCDDWPEYEWPMWIVRPDGSRWIHGLKWPDMEMCQSWDFTFKDTKATDYVVGQVWLRHGPSCYLLYQVRDRMNFTKSLQTMEEVTAMWPQAVQKFIEDKANGPAVINSLNKKIAGIIPIEPEGSKYARAQAVSPFTHSGNVILPAPLTGDGEPFAPWVPEFKQEMRDFPNGSHDDQVDTFSQAINRLLLVPMLSEDDTYQPEEFDEMDARGWAISPV